MEGNPPFLCGARVLVKAYKEKSMDGLEISEAVHEVPDEMPQPDAATPLSKIIPLFSLIPTPVADIDGFSIRFRAGPMEAEWREGQAPHLRNKG
ncbi:hypothetical protein U1Q18_036053 [Sarracenia purpurea var. burkii]